MENPQRLLTYKQLFYLSVASLGLQAAGTFEINNASGLFKFLGASDRQVGWLWLIPPVTGLIVQPVLGQVSDLIDTRYGKRMPFIYGGAVLSCLSLVMLAFSEALWLTAAMVLVLSCSINCATEGLRSLVGDLTPNRQKSKAFAWQAVFGASGAMLAGAVPWLLNSTRMFVKPGEAGFKIPAELKVAFFIGALIVFQTASAMFRQIREKDASRSTDGPDPDASSAPCSTPDPASDPAAASASRATPRSAPRSLLRFLASLGRELYGNLRRTPPVIRRMFLVQVLTWAGLFCVWIYFGLALAQSIYGLPPGADVSSNPGYQAMLTKGVFQSGICFSIYQFVGVLYTLALPLLADRFDPNRVHAVSLLAGAVTLLAVPWLHNIWAVYIAMLGLGLFSGSLNTLPYAIVAGEVPARKMGACMGIFNITITVPQILCGMIIGPLNHSLFGNRAMFVVGLAGLLIGVAGLLLLRQQGIDVFLIFYEWVARLFRRADDKAPP